MRTGRSGWSSLRARYHMHSCRFFLVFNFSEKEARECTGDYAFDCKSMNLGFNSPIHLSTFEI